MQWHPINGPFQLHFRKLNPMSKSGTHPSLCYTSQRRIPQIGRHYPDRSRVNSMKWKQALNESTCNLPLLEKQPVYPMTSKIVIKMLLLTHQWTDFRALPSEAPLCTHFFFQNSSQPRSLYPTKPGSRYVSTEVYRTSFKMTDSRLGDILVS